MKIIKLYNPTQRELLETEVQLAKNTIAVATQPTELRGAVETVAKLKKFIADAKTKLKEVEVEPKKQIKELETMFKTLDKQVKEKFSETQRTFKQTKEKKIVDEETGEVETTLRTYDNNNHGKGMFTHTPPKIEVVLDRDALMKNSDFTKQITVIDEDKLKAHMEEKGLEGLPTKTIEIPGSIGIQYQQALKATLDAKD